MDPGTFERIVASRLEADGYAATLTPSTNDWGVDIFAERAGERLAVQVKMYRGARAVNRQMIFELYGASRFFDCTGAVIATDGEIRRDARTAAEKLGVRVLQWTDDMDSAVEDLVQAQKRPATARLSDPTFEQIWATYVMPLAGRTLVGDRGLRNTILSVDWGGVRRVSSTGAPSRIPIEPIRWAIETILEFGSVTRGQIDEQYAGRASSGIQLILEQVPLFNVARIDGRSTIQLREGAE
jgi:hypothetical protein